MQEPAADKPADDRHIPAAHAGGQAVQDEDTFKADRHGAAVLRKPGADARLP